MIHLINWDGILFHEVTLLERISESTKFYYKIVDIR